MLPLFAILIVRVPFHAPTRGGGNKLTGVSEQSMGVWLSDRTRTIQTRESPLEATQSAVGISGYNDLTPEHIRRLVANMKTLVVRPAQMLETTVHSFLFCNGLERVR